MEKTLRKQIKQGKITFYPVLLKVSKNCIVRHIEIFLKITRESFISCQMLLRKKLQIKSSLKMV